jgi:hypothetical protein
MTKLRDLADPEFNPTDAPRRWGSPPGSSWPGSPSRNQPEQVAFQSGVSPFVTTGVNMTAQATVSADRRYVRLNVAPVFQTLGRSTSAVFSVPLIPGAP